MPMNAEQLLKEAASVVAGRRGTYGQPIDLFEHVAKRWSLVLGIEVTPVQTILCLIDLKGRAAHPRSTTPGQHHGRRRLRRLPDRGKPMMGPSGYRSCLARAQASTAPSDEDLLAMRRTAWRAQGVIMLRPEDVRDDWTRQALINEANRLYGRRGGER